MFPRRFFPSPWQNRLLLLTLPLARLDPRLVALRRNRLRLLEHQLEGELSLIREALDGIDLEQGQAPYGASAAVEGEILDEVLEEAQEAASAPRPRYYRRRRP